MKQTTITIRNRRGLHARASSLFVKCAERFDAEIEVEKGGSKVGATSLMDLMMLAAAQGDEITLCAEGREAEAALAALSELVENKFGED